MTKISKVLLFNQPKPNASIELSIAPKLTVLTGYNGIGKTSVLASIHATTAAFNQELFSYRHEWASRITDQAGFVYTQLKFKYLGVEMPPLPDEINPTEVDLQFLYEHVKKLYDKTLSERVGTVLDVARSQSIHSLTLYSPFHPLGAEVEVGIRSVLYRDEVIYDYTDKENTRRLEELDVLSSSVNLDKTLFGMLTAFSSIAVVGELGLEISSLIHKLRSELLSGKSKKKSESLDRLEQIAKINTKQDHSLLLDELNSYFSETGRRVEVAENGMLEVCISGDSSPMPWHALSRGEKTLISLLLMAYLYRDKGYLFLLDEPDLSLHISWQRKLLPSFLKLAPNAQFVISTHSPALIGNTDSEAIINVGNFVRG